MNLRTCIDKTLQSLQFFESDYFIKDYVTMLDFC